MSERLKTFASSACSTIISPRYMRRTVEETFDAVMAHKLDCIQFNFACAGLESMPDKIDCALAKRIGAAARERDLHMAAVSGTFNMIDPDPKSRADGFRRLEVIAANCRAIGTNLITLCTGTRDPKDMWRAHPDNDSTDAWRDLVNGMRHALQIAEKHDVRLGVEPEPANVVNSAAKARRLLDEMKSPRLKIVMDGANLEDRGRARLSSARRESAEADERRAEDRRALPEAFELLGRDIIIAHAKDVAADGSFVAAGQGVLDYDLYIHLLRRVKFSGPLILHALSEAEVDGVTEFLRRKLRAAQVSK